MARRSKPRRGVLLLIVLSLLVLFVLVGLTFVVSASQYASLSRSDSRSKQTGMPGSKLATTALYQIMRDTLNPYSRIAGHSLLEDVNGRDYLIGTTISPHVEDFESSGRHITQSFRFQVRLEDLGSELDPRPRRTVGNEVLRPSVPTSRLDDYFGGCVLTFVSGNATGRSTRVVRFSLDDIVGDGNSNGYVDDGETWAPLTGRVITEGVLLDGGIVPAPQAGEQGIRFVINGRPFNGTGAGFDYRVDDTQNSTGKLVNALTYTTAAGNVSIPLALIPNYTAYREFKSLEEISFSGLDEPWDAADYQNLFLAKLPPSSDVAMASGTTPFQINTGGTIPSFHRPFLLSYIQKNFAAVWNDPTAGPAMRRQFMFRPNSMDHPGFTGGNPAFDPINGPWDVDNDGDGIPDSVWVDFGLDPITGPDGQLYKPLIAPLIVDMDGRLNLNTADSLEKSKMSRLLDPQLRFNSVDILSAVEPIDRNVRGLGFGPADVTVNESPTFLRQRYGAAVTTTKDHLNNPLAIQTPQVLEPYGPGQDINPTANINDLSWIDVVDDDLALMRQGGIGSAKFTLGNNFNDQVSLDTGFGSPVDLLARSFPLIDPTGNMVWSDAGRFDGVNDPYEAEPLQITAQDKLLGLTELEGMLNYDSKYLRSRLSAASYDSFTASRFTTHSVYNPAPTTLNPGRYRHSREQDLNNDGIVDVVGDGLRRSIRDMFAAKVRRALLAANPGAPPKALDLIAWDRIGAEKPRTLRMGGIFAPTEGGPGQIRNITDLIAPELLRGEKLNLNRSLQPNTKVAEYLKPLGQNINTTELKRQLAAQNRIILEKQKFATHLYNLMMLVTEDDFQLPTDPKSGVQNNVEVGRLLHARRIAQWAINVVDFGDADSVMTRFPYDPFPFNDQVETDEVWGMEHPELLITETLAFHDRRVKDTATAKTRKEGDPHLDSPVPPQGSLFVELYATRAQLPVQSQRLKAVSRGPEDLYTNNRQLEIYKLLPPRTTNPVSVAKPVWRLAISERHVKEVETSARVLAEASPDVVTFEPSDMDVRVGPPANVKLERFIWFSDIGPVEPNPSIDITAYEELPRNTYVNRTTTEPLMPVNPVNPGDYIVVGPRAVTPIGLAKDDDTYQGTSPQVIDLRHLDRSLIYNHMALANLDMNQQSDVDSFSQSIPQNFGVVSRRLPDHRIPDNAQQSEVGNLRAVLDDPSKQTQFGPKRVVPILAKTISERAVGCSISEPTDHERYYPAPDDATGVYTDVLDEPLDERDPPSTVGGVAIPPGEVSPLWEDPQGDEEERLYPLASGTRGNVRTIFLQRLANPDLPWNPPVGHPLHNPELPFTNPYRTVDWMPVDLTVFNSLDEETSQNKPPTGAFDPQDPFPIVKWTDEQDVRIANNKEAQEKIAGLKTLVQDPANPNFTPFNLASREKNAAGMNLWAWNSDIPLPPDLMSAGLLQKVGGDKVADQIEKKHRLLEEQVDLQQMLTTYLRQNCWHTLGWLNRSWDDVQGPVARGAFAGQPRDGTGHYRIPRPAGLQDPSDPAQRELFLAQWEVDRRYQEAPVAFAGLVAPNSPLAVASTFPTLIWNNRPYANEFEAMLVPATSQARLTREFSISQATSPIISNNSGPNRNRLSYYSGFSHLLNFFHSSLGSPDESLPVNSQLPPPPAAGNYYRIFDFVNVPSRFRGTRDWFNQLPNGAPLTINNPFSQINAAFTEHSYSKFREPGRVNLNTAVNANVLTNLGMSTANGQQFSFALSGFLDSSSPTGFYPAQYPNPLRPGVAADLRPPMPDPLGMRPGVDATALRSDGPSGEPLLAANVEPRDLNGQTFNPGTILSTGTQNRQRNAFFRYRELQKIGGSASNQSNVFAIWLTVGYFAIEPNYPLTKAQLIEEGAEAGQLEFVYDYTKPYYVDSAHPDGYRFGAEMGSEFGNVVRNRSFFIVDRSIPVAFEPGVNHNVDNAILLRKHYE